MQLCHFLSRHNYDSKLEKETRLDALNQPTSTSIDLLCIIYVNDRLAYRQDFAADSVTLVRQRTIFRRWSRATLQSLCQHVNNDNYFVSAPSASLQEPIIC